MIKRTILLESKAYLSTKNEQLIITYPNEERTSVSVPIEDLGLVLIEHRQITLTSVLLEKLMEAKVAVINCNSQHMPSGQLLPYVGHTEQSERYRWQIEASLPLKKNLWQQTISQKILNQGTLLGNNGIPNENMAHWAKSVTSGDTQNHEARAAAYFWKHLFGTMDFKRDREGEAPNNLLNYGYAILRAITARAIVSSGLLPSLGIHHKSKYNAFCLADDLMEPYRPFVDAGVLELVNNDEDISTLNRGHKKALLAIPVLNVFIDGKTSPLMLAMSRTTNSLVECFKGERRKILVPEYGK
jgi:CRISPR-associated protein Cas1